MIIGRIQRSSSSPPLFGSETMTTPDVFVVVVVVVVVVVADAWALKEERSKERRWARQGRIGAPPVLPRDCHHRCLPPLFSPPLTNFLIVMSISPPPRPPFITEAATEAEADVTMIIGRIQRSSSSPPLSGSETMTTPDVFVVVFVVVVAVVVADALALKEE